MVDKMYLSTMVVVDLLGVEMMGLQEVVEVVF
jgi:hypothetical protein